MKIQSSSMKTKIFVSALWLRQWVDKSPKTSAAVRKPLPGKCLPLLPEKKLRLQWFALLFGMGNPVCMKSTCKQAVLHSSCEESMNPTPHGYFYLKLVPFLRIKSPLAPRSLPLSDLNISYSILLANSNVLILLTQIYRSAILYTSKFDISYC